MKFHLVLGRTIDLDALHAQALLGQRPRHVMWDLQRRLLAEVHVPANERPSAVDHAQGGILGPAQNWAVARNLASHFTERDVVFCNGEDIGIPLAATCSRLAHPPRIAMFVHAGDRPRGRVAFRLHRVAERVSLFITNCRTQVAFLHGYLKVPMARIVLLHEQTDTRFFSPGPASPTKLRPVIASVGLEKRDYRTLAEATHDLPVDVRISAFSADVKPLRKSLPQVLPANMTQRFYEWPDLLQLYRDADIVAVPLFAGRDTSGVTTLLEAMSCARPVIVTGTPGLSDYLKTPGIASIVEPQDAAGLRAAIVRWLDHPQDAATAAAAAHQRTVTHHNSEDYLDKLVDCLEGLAKSVSKALR